MDLALIAANSRRVAGGDARASIERVVVSARMLLPLALAQGAAAESELARDLRGRAATDGSVALLLPAGRASDTARLDTGVRQYRLSPALRDAIVAALAEAEQGASATSSASSASASPSSVRSGTQGAALGNSGAQGADPASLRAWAVSAEATVARGGPLSGPLSGSLSTQLAETGETSSNAGGAMLNAGESAARTFARNADVDSNAPQAARGRGVSFTQALLDGDAQSPAAVRQTAERLQLAVEHSGLFYESHVAQWARGQRPTDALRQELLALGAIGPESSGPAADRVPAQLDLLQQHSFVLQGPAWAGQSSLLEFAIAAHDPADATDERGASAAPSDAHAVVSARLRLNMPNLGPIEVRLRLAGESIATVIAGATGAAVPAALADLRACFEARGLKPVSLVAMPPENLK